MWAGPSAWPPPPAPGSLSPELPLLGRQSGKAVTPLDLGRFRSKVFRSVLDQMKPPGDEQGEGPRTPGAGPGPGAGRGGGLQKEPPLQLDTPSRFLSRDQLFRPSFNVKVVPPAVENYTTLNEMSRLSARKKPLDKMYS